MKLKKILAMLSSGVLAAAMLGACGSSDSSDGDASKAGTTAATTTTAVTTAAAPASATPIDISQGPTEAMYTRSVLNAGDTTRLQAKMNAALADKKHMTNIAFIGGSITQGSSASTENQYTNRVIDWWEDNISIYVAPIYAGIGATDSYIGVHRVDADVLAKNPDIIFIEFSVNDTDTTLNKLTYDSLVRKCLNAENHPAVVLVCMTQDNGTSLQEVHAEIGKAYNLPMISYHDAIMPEIQAGSLSWKSISDDNIHPNNNGHPVLAKLITHYFDGVLSGIDSTVTEAPAFTTPAVTGDLYANATMGNQNTGNVTVTDRGTFTDDVAFQTFTGGWGTTTGGSIKFEVNARNIGMIYLESINGDMGVAQVYVDGTLSKTIDAAFPNGWGNYAQGAEVYTSSAAAKHTVEVKVTGDIKGFQIISLLLS
ncbi:MAG: SGNH/GDSL hydrolase family protein [Oscillospiraceae bacterium]